MGIDYRQVLADLHAEESRLESELKIIRTSIPGVELMANRMSVISPTSLKMSAYDLRGTIPVGGQFSGMGTKEAIISLLSQQSSPLMPSVIAKGLLEGGIITRSSDFQGMVTTTLAQMKADGLVERMEDGWKVLSRTIRVPG